jgi:hypothetical protein
MAPVKQVVAMQVTSCRGVLASKTTHRSLCTYLQLKGIEVIFSAEMAASVAVAENPYLLTPSPLCSETRGKVL